MNINDDIIIDLKTMQSDNSLCYYMLNLIMLIILANLLVNDMKDYYKTNIVLYKQNCNIINYTTNTIYNDYRYDNHYNDIITGKSKYINSSIIFEIHVLYTNNIVEDLYIDGYSTIQTRDTVLLKLQITNQITCYYNPTKKILRALKHTNIHHYKYYFTFSLILVIIGLIINIIYMCLLLCSYLRLQRQLANNMP